MPTFSEHVSDRVERAFRSIPQGRRRGIYVLSLFVYDEYDDPLFPTVAPGYNTEDQVERALRSASSAAEARWNFAYWEQVQLAVIGDSEHDPEGAALREEWIRTDLGLWYDDGVEFDNRGAPITQAFVDLLVGVAQRLHRDGIVEEFLGEPLPIVIHELEYYDKIAEENLRANPPGVVPDQFVDWCRGVA
jgi:hypothetical protein